MEDPGVVRQWAVAFGGGQVEGGDARNPRPAGLVRVTPLGAGHHPQQSALLHQVSVDVIDEDRKEGRGMVWVRGSGGKKKRENEGGREGEKMKV